MKSKNVNQAIILRIKAGFVFLLFGLNMCVTGGSALAIDYFEITNPKFVPVKVGLIEGAGSEVTAVQKVFKANLEKVLYFQIIDGTKAEFLKSEEVVFRLELLLKKNPDQLEITLWTQGEESPVAQKLLPLEEADNLRKTGLLLADWFVGETLNFKGVSDSKIAYTSQKTNRRKNIMLSSYDGTLQKRFSYNLGSNNLASWSFDNKNILYTTFTRSSVQLTIQPSIRLRAKILSFPSGFQPLGASWRKDGKSILLTLMNKGNSDIYSYNLADSKLEKIFAWKSLETSPQMSQDGQKIAFVSDSARPRRPQIYVHNMLTNKTERVTFRGSYNSSPKWSPDGSQLVYERQIKGVFQLFKYTLLTRRHLQLTFGRYDSEKPDWSPNGKQIVFSAKKKNVSKLYYISAFGGRSIRVTTNANDIAETNPVWSK
ncbi:MAG: PD40 domain-containing protein [Proteobacteria bacterium]|nr:PD40 domain-containing protein [Pseudomonadota bacterium]